MVSDLLNVMIVAPVQSGVHVSGTLSLIKDNGLRHFRHLSRFCIFEISDVLFENLTGCVQCLSHCVHCDNMVIRLLGNESMGNRILKLSIV